MIKSNKFLIQTLLIGGSVLIVFAILCFWLGQSDSYSEIEILNSKIRTSSIALGIFAVGILCFTRIFKAVLKTYSELVAGSNRLERRSRLKKNEIQTDLKEMNKSDIIIKVGGFNANTSDAKKLELLETILAISEIEGEIRLYNKEQDE